MIKYLFLFTTFLISTPTEKSIFVLHDVEWYLDYEFAIEKAQANDKTLLVYFTGSDWCAPCKKLHKDLLDSEEFKKVILNYNPVYVDIPRRIDVISPEQMVKNKKLMEELNTRKVFPLLVAVSPDGKIVDEHSGYGMNGYIQHHLNFLERNK